MKKFMKGCGITALIMIAIGLVMACVVSFTKGTAYMNFFLDDVTDGRASRWFGWNDGRNHGSWDLSEDAFEGVKDIAGLGEFEGYDIDEASMFSTEHPVRSGNVGESFSTEGIANLHVELGGSLFYVEESSDDTFYVEAVNAGKFQAYESGGTIYIKSNRKTRIWDEIEKCSVTLYIPENYVFSKVEMELGAGLMELGTLSGQEMKLEVGAGQITADYLESGNLDISVGAGEVIVNDMSVTELSSSVGAGHFYAAGTVNGNIDAECAMGSLELDLNAAEEDFDYSVECVAGAVEVGNNSYSGLASERNWSNNAGRNMELECSMGQIVVSFWE